MGRISPLVLLLLLSVASSGCAIGAGALTAAGRSALVTNSDRKGEVAVGAYAGAMPSASFTFFDQNPAATGLSWAFHAGANLFINGLGGTVEYQLRYDQLNFAGPFRGGSQTHGVMGYFGIAPLPFLSVDLGGGALFAGTFGLLGSCGEVLQSCETSGYRGEAGGVRFATRLNLNVIGPSSFWGTLVGSVRDPSTGLYQRTSSEGPILPITSSVRLELGYQRLSVTGAAPVPQSVGAFNIGVELLFGLF